MNQTAQKTEVSVERVDRATRRNELAEITFQPNGQMFQPRDGRELMDMANMMSTAGPMVKDIYRNNPGPCMALIAVCAPYGLNPLLVSWKTYQTKPDAPIAYEAQVIVAMLNASGAVSGTLLYRYEGEGQNRVCIASGLLRGTKDPVEVTSPPLAQIQPKNSPLWKTDPDQQLAYYTGRAWARRYKPEMLLGVYDVDEMPAIGPDNARDVTPSRPRRGGVMYDEPSAPETDDPFAGLPTPVAEAEIVDEPADRLDDLFAAAEAEARAGGTLAFMAWWRVNGQEQKTLMAADGPRMARIRDICTEVDAAAAVATDVEAGGSGEEAASPTPEEMEAAEREAQRAIAQQELGFVDGDTSPRKRA